MALQAEDHPRLLGHGGGLAAGVGEVRKLLGGHVRPLFGAAPQAEDVGTQNPCGGDVIGKLLKGGHTQAEVGAVGGAGNAVLLLEAGDLVQSIGIPTGGVDVTSPLDAGESCGLDGLDNLFGGVLAEGYGHKAQGILTHFVISFLLRASRVSNHSSGSGIGETGFMADSAPTVTVRVSRGGAAGSGGRLSTKAEP